MDKYCCNKNDEKTALLADFLRIISEENRLKIICFLMKNGERCVCEIQEFLDLPQNLVSHHLKVLRDFPLLSSRKEGLKVYYSIDKKNLSEFMKILDEILNKNGEQNGREKDQRSR